MAVYLQAVWTQRPWSAGTYRVAAGYERSAVHPAPQQKGRLSDVILTSLSFLLNPGYLRTQLHGEGTHRDATRAGPGRR